VRNADGGRGSKVTDDVLQKSKNHAFCIRLTGNASLSRFLGRGRTLGRVFNILNPATLKSFLSSPRPKIQTVLFCSVFKFIFAIFHG
jgi:hypothetical protein